MFIWDFVADKILGQIVDWFYSQVVGFLGNFFSEMGSMGAELFEMNWVQSVVLFFSYLGWALFATGLVVAVFECGIEYSAGRGNVKETALNVLKGFLAVSLFTQVPVRLYSLAISLQGTLTAGITGFGSTSIGDAAKAALADLENLESLTESTYPLRGFGRETSSSWDRRMMSPMRATSRCASRRMCPTNRGRSSCLTRPFSMSSALPMMP